MAKPNRRRKAAKKKKAKVKPTQTCFVISPFGAWFDEYFDALYVPAIEAAGLAALRGDDIYRPGTIIHDVWELTKSADVILADLSTKNANVFYELGLAHAIKKPVVLITDSIDDVPFDLRHLRVIEYDKNQPDWGEDLKSKITSSIAETLSDPSRAILATFLEAKAEGKTVEVSQGQKDILTIKQDLEALRVGVQALKRRDRPHSIGSSREARERIAFLVSEGYSKARIIDDLTRRGVPASYAVRELERFMSLSDSQTSSEAKKDS